MRLPSRRRCVIHHRFSRTGLNPITRKFFCSQRSTLPILSSMKPFQVMFICSGNICRSPLAHAVFEHLTAEAGLSGQFEIESSGTGAWHVGEQADSRMRKIASAHGVKINHRSRQLHREDLSDYHLLLAMDHHNHRDTMALARSPQEREKVRLFRDFDPAGTGDVPDPWYGGLDGFEDVWRIVRRTCESLLKDLSGE